jgi:hypothetical protein
MMCTSESRVWNADINTRTLMQASFLSNPFYLKVYILRFSYQIEITNFEALEIKLIQRDTILHLRKIS